MWYNKYGFRETVDGIRDSKGFDRGLAAGEAIRRRCVKSQI